MPQMAQDLYLKFLINDLEKKRCSLIGASVSRLGNPVTQVFWNNVCWGVLLLVCVSFGGTRG